MVATEVFAAEQDLRFGSIPVDARMARALSALGYTSPTPIQEQTIPLLREGRDVIGLAKTGSGKTAGFGIPMVESIKSHERFVQAIVLTPTRELASQVAAALVTFGQSSGVRVVAIYGGVSMLPQLQALRGGAQIVVGTPGRVLDHVARGTLDLSRVRLVILDEADRMLDVGFAPDIDRILRAVPETRQTGLFSATFPAEVEALGIRHTRDAVRVSPAAEDAKLDTLEEQFLRVGAASDKIDKLHDILIDPGCRLALVFRRTTHKADKLASDLERRGFEVATLHGRRSQAQREKALGALKSGRLKVLVATDIASRGIDITGLTHVVNYDLPDTAEAYTHRVGRTARMGANGIAITLVAPEDELELRGIQRKLSPQSGRASATPAPRSGHGAQGPRGGRPRTFRQSSGAAGMPQAPARVQGDRPQYGVDVDRVRPAAAPRNDRRRWRS